MQRKLSGSVIFFEAVFEKNDTDHFQLPKQRCLHFDV